MEDVLDLIGEGFLFGAHLLALLFGLGVFLSILLVLVRVVCWLLGIEWITAQPLQPEAPR